MDISDRVGGNVGWPLTKYHRNAIEFLEDLNEDTTFEEYRTMAVDLMAGHAIARNDIYDGESYRILVNHKGLLLEEPIMVSREEKDVRMMLYMWFN